MHKFLISYNQFYFISHSKLSQMADKRKAVRNDGKEAARGRAALEREMAALMANEPNVEGAILSPHEMQILGGDQELQYLLSHQNPSQTISRRVKNINDEVARQRQYLPQFKHVNGKFKGMKNVMMNQPQASAPSKQGKRGSAVPMQAHYDERLVPVGSLDMHRGSEREMRATVATTATRRLQDGVTGSGLSSTKETFDGYTTSPKMQTRPRPGSNFKDNLELLQRQQQMQQTLLLEQQARTLKGLKSPKKRKKLKGGDIEPVWGATDANIGSTYPAVSGATQQIPSSLGILRSGMAGQPLLYEFNNDSALMHTTNNFSSGLGGYNQRASKLLLDSQVALNKSSFPRMNEYAKASTAVLRNQRRNAGDITTVPSSHFRGESGDVYELSRSQAALNATGFGYGSGHEQEFTTPILKQGRAVYASGGGRKVDRIKEAKLVDSDKNVVRIHEEKVRSPSTRKVKVSDPTRFQSEISKRKKKLRLDKFDQSAISGDVRTPGADRYFETPTGGYVNYVNGVPVDGKRTVHSPNRHRDGHVHGASNLPTIQKTTTNAGKNQPLKDARLASGMPSNPTKAMLASKSKARVHALLTSQPSIEREPAQSPMKVSKRQLAPMDNKNDIDNKASKAALIRGERSRRNVQSKAALDVGSRERRKGNSRLPPDASAERLQSPNQVNLLIQNSTQVNMKIMDDLTPGRLPSERQRSLSPGPKISRKRTSRSITKRSLSPRRSAKKSKKSLSPEPPEGLLPDPDKTSSYDGHGVRKQKKKKRHPPNNLYRFDERYFRKGPAEPPLFRVDVDELDYDHLKNDDLDEISKMEVTYKILKQQLREHQKKIIEAKEQRKRELAQARMAKKARQRTMSPIDLNRFARHIKHFELYGAQRDLNPELKRIVKNLMCQEHKFMYCPCCKQYEEGPLDPLENIQKFMDYIKEEQNKLHKRKTKAQRLRQIKQRKRRLHGSAKKLPDDSASDITYLEEEEVLAKYLDETMTKKQRYLKERKITQRRLYGMEKVHECQRIGCTTAHKVRPATPEHRPTVRMELREVQEPISMHDESNSAHQFSLKDMSVQADSEARLDVAMQTSAIDYASAGNQASKQDAHSIAMQASEIEYKSNNMQTSLFGPNAPRNEYGTQTDPKYTRKKTPEKRTKNNQTERVKDMYKDDWLHSQVYKNALRAEAEKRGIPAANLALSEDESCSDDDGNTTSILDRYQSAISIENQKKQLMVTQGSFEGQDQANAQDPDTTDAATAHEREVYENTGGIRNIGLGFMKDKHDKGNIRVLTESELLYVKKLLKQKNHEYWKEPSTLNDLHRHCKFTIRKLTQKMANIENYAVFKHLKDPTREHTLYLVYRACVLFKALAHSQKIFKLVCETIFDQESFEKIRKGKSIAAEDQKFVKRRELLFKRIMTQCNTFLESYKVFDKFTFKNAQITEYVQQELNHVSEYKRIMDDVKKANPEAAKQAQDALKQEQEREAEVKAEFLRNIEKQKERQVLEEQQQTHESVEPEPLSPGDDYVDRRVVTSADAPDRLDIQKGQENGKVSQETIDVINKQLEAAANSSGVPQYDGGKRSDLLSPKSQLQDMAVIPENRVMSPRVVQDGSPLVSKADLGNQMLNTDGNEVENENAGVFARGSFGSKELLDGVKKQLNDQSNDQMTPRL